jgi:hypothetical protein
MLPAGGGATGGFTSSNKLSGLAGIAGISLGGGGSGPEGERALARLETRSFLTNHIKEKNLKPILFAGQWDDTEKQWTNQEPSDRKAYKLLLSMIFVNKVSKSKTKNKAGVITLSMEWENPSNLDKIAEIANDLVSSMNSHAKQRAILEAKNSILFLQKELKRTSIVNSQTMLYSLIEQQMRNIMMANVRDEFVFTVIDPAIIPNKPESSPALKILFLVAIFGLFFSSFVAVIINSFKRQQNPNT